MIPGWPTSCRRVVFVAPRTSETSGGAAVVHTLSMALARNGTQVEHISLEPGAGSPAFPTYVVDAHPERHRRASFRGSRGLRNRARGLLEVGTKRIDGARDRARLRRVLDGYGAESVLVFTHVSAKIAADRSGWVPRPDGPLLVGQHHSQFESIDLESWLRGAITRHFQDLDVFMALTEQDAAQFQAILDPACHAMPNPVEPPVTAPRDRQQLAVAISRLSGEKAMDVMVRCFVAATDDPELDGWRLEIHGDGDQADVLRAAVRESGSQRVRLAGHCDDVFDVLADASVLLMTSWMEGLPVSVLEAATMGVPTIAFDCSPGVHSLVADGRGFLVPPGDEAAYTRVLASALRDPDELGRRGQVARSCAEAYFPEAVLESWGRVLQRCYRDRAAPPG